ncbi:hypothetical protein ACFWYW_24120 [Nonomuraea sp. NPDC059023]|uniref:hypothetical protein n=1 Tax=unclassified Nonomuraea TaxID=2593643 RepID=UPI00368F14C0
MPNYANYIPNPSLELGSTGWQTEGSGSLSRGGSNAVHGSYALKLTYTGYGEAKAGGGVSTLVAIEPGAGPFTLSATLKGLTESNGASYNAGVTITVYDLLPGEAATARQQLKQQTFAYTTNGRVAIRNFTPRPAADRLVVAFTTNSSYYRSASYSNESRTFWTEYSFGQYTTSEFPYSTSSPSGTGVDSSTYSSYTSDSSWSNNGTTSGYRKGSGTGGINGSGQQYYYYYKWNQASQSRSVQTSPAVYGGTATFYVDAIQLERGTTETTYVDGSTPGYVWSGTPGNSPTLAMVALAGSGTASGNGSLPDMMRLTFMVAQGSSKNQGQLTADTHGVLGGRGLGRGNGTVRMWGIGAFRAIGTGGSLGSAYLYSIKKISASGTSGPGSGANAPRLAIVKAWPTFGSGTGTGTGSLALSFPQPIEMNGRALGNGTLAMGVGWQLTGDGYAAATGSLDLSDGTPQAAFSDFAIFGVTEEDPLKLGVGATNAGTASGAFNAAWNRVYAEFVSPADQISVNGSVAWRRAAYAAVGFRFNAVPANNYHQLTCVQAEAAAQTAPGPRSYSTAQTLRPLVVADRINYAIGDVWPFFGSQNITVTREGTSPYTDDPKPVAKVVYQPGYTGFMGGGMIAPPPGSPCVVSLHIKTDKPVILRLAVTRGQGWVEQGTSEHLSLTPEMGWTRIQAPFTASDLGQFWHINFPYDGAVPLPLTLTIAGIQVEEGSRATPYFHMKLGSRDYYLRYNGTDTNLGAFHYRDIDQRTARLVSALEEQTPMGIRVGKPEFGVIPHLD